MKIYDDKLEPLILKRIDRLRREMIRTAEETGINSIETLICSRKLDRLLNLHLKYFTMNSNTNNTITL